MKKSDEQWVCNSIAGVDSQLRKDFGELIDALDRKLTESDAKSHANEAFHTLYRYALKHAAHCHCPFCGSVLSARKLHHGAGCPLRVIGDLIE